MPDAASVGRTQDVVQQIEEIALKTPGIKHTVAISGQSILLNANASNFGALYLMLDEFEHRTTHELSSEAIAAALGGAASQARCPQAIVNIFGAPPVEGLGHGGRLQDHRAGHRRQRPVGLAESGRPRGRRRRGRPQLKGVFTSFRADTPWVELVIDRTQAKDRGVSIDDIRTTLEANLGPYYINDFNRFGRTWQVNVQARDVFRQSVEDVKQLKVRNNLDEMVPLAAFSTVRFKSGPVMVMRYNMYLAAAVHADAGPGHQFRPGHRASGGGRRPDLPQTMRTEWTELALLAAADRQHRDVGVRAGGGAGVPGAGGAVRKLGAAAGGHPGGADVSAVRHRRRA